MKKNSEINIKTTGKKAPAAKTSLFTEPRPDGLACKDKKHQKIIKTYHHFRKSINKPRKKAPAAKISLFTDPRPDGVACKDKHQKFIKKQQQINKTHHHFRKENQTNRKKTPAANKNIIYGAKA